LLLPCLLLQWLLLQWLLLLLNSLTALFPWCLCVGVQMGCLYCPLLEGIQPLCHVSEVRGGMGASVSSW
jgi:hypothetical protein